MIVESPKARTVSEVLTLEQRGLDADPRSLNAALTLEPCGLDAATGILAAIPFGLFLWALILLPVLWWA
jgi:hypothetical protein